jgi:hypothetical protein
MAGIFPRHLFDDHLGIGKNVKGSRAKSHGILQSFEKGNILRYVVILMSDPSLDPDGSIFATIDHHSNTRGTWIPQRTTINVSNEIQHRRLVLREQCATCSLESRYSIGSPTQGCRGREKDPNFPQNLAQKIAIAV